MGFRWIRRWLPVQWQVKNAGLQHGAMHIVSYLSTLSKQAVLSGFTKTNIALRRPDLKQENLFPTKFLFVSNISLPYNLIVHYSEALISITRISFVEGTRLPETQKSSRPRSEYAKTSERTEFEVEFYIYFMEISRRFENCSRRTGSYTITKFWVRKS
jgi:hypothetical protein